MRVRVTADFPGLVIAECGTLWGPSGRRLKPFTRPRNPYPQFNLYRGKGSWKRLAVHTVVCIAFHGPRPDGLIIRHLDGDPANHHADNLRWGTQEENEADKIRHGTAPRGERHGSHVLTEQDVKMIRTSELSNAALALLLGVSDTTISNVRTGRTWRHLA